MIAHLINGSFPIFFRITESPFIHKIRTLVCIFALLNFQSLNNSPSPILSLFPCLYMNIVCAFDSIYLSMCVCVKSKVCFPIFHESFLPALYIDCKNLLFNLCVCVHRIVCVASVFSFSRLYRIDWLSHVPDYWTSKYRFPTITTKGSSDISVYSNFYTLTNGLI